MLACCFVKLTKPILVTLVVQNGVGYDRIYRSFDHDPCPIAPATANGVCRMAVAPSAVWGVNNGRSRDQGSIPAMRSAALATTGSEYVIEAPVPKSAVAAMTVDSSFPQWFPSCDDAAINLHCP